MRVYRRVLIVHLKTQGLNASIPEGVVVAGEDGGELSREGANQVCILLIDNSNVRRSQWGESTALIDGIKVGALSKLILPPARVRKSLPRIN